MTVEEAERLMPVGFLKVASGSDQDAPNGDGSQTAMAQGEGFTGSLRDVEDCSLQCDGFLNVQCRNGVVIGVTLELYNDFNHTGRKID